tara:strand:+ start:195 stop:638 length:444 start_codon:yes stop_codon:yes gene_type:complete
MLLIRITEDRLYWLKGDPVRPKIPLEMRVKDHMTSWASLDALQKYADPPLAVVCTALSEGVPKTERQLYKIPKNPDHVIYYTVWSNGKTKGAGRDIITSALDSMKLMHPGFGHVTLSPKTQMARRFHLKNGATEWRVNSSTVNFRYV